MRLLIFTLLFSFLSFGSLYAGVQEWNISSAEFNALGEINATVTVNGLTIHAKADKTVVVEPNAKTLDGMEFTTRMKLGGAGSLVPGAEARVLSFDVTGNATISVAAISSSSSADRELLFINSAGDTIATKPVLGASISMVTFDYVGDATTINIASKTSGINVYYLKSVTEDGGEEPVVSSDAMAIFDPATVNPADLKAGMSVVEIGGKKYLQVVVDGWNSILDVPAFKFEPGMTAFAEFKYVVAQTQYTAAQINGVVQLIDTINLMKPSWSTDSVPTTTGLSQSNPTGVFKKVSAGAAATSKLVHQVQFFGQQTVSWGAVAGDTLWVGKVRAYTKEADVVFDPATYDPDLLPDGMEVVDVEGTKYCKIALKGWGSAITVDPFVVNAGVYTHMTVTAKYEVGTSGYALSNINTFLKLANAANNVEVVVGGHASSATFKEYKADIKTAGTVEMFQVAGQEKTGWSAVTGDTLWVSKVKLINEVPADPNVIADPANFDGSLGTGWSIVDVDGTKYFKVAIDGWNSWTNLPSYTFPAGKNAFKAAVKYEAGTSGAAIDGLGAFLKFSTGSWAEIGASRSPVTTEFADQVVTLAANEGNVAGVFQVAIQDANNGFSAISGDFLYIGKIVAVTTAPVTFVLDDTKHKMYDGFSIRGSWKTNSGIFDSQWNGGVNHTTFADSTGANPVPDNIWEVTIKMVADGGTNTWKWGFLDLLDNWLVTGPDLEFKVTDWTPVTNTYIIGGTGVKDVASQLKLYPNPVENVLNVSGKEVESISIYNLTGSKVLTNQLSNNIDVSNLAKGTYIVKVVDQNGETAISKFSKK